MSIDANQSLAQSTLDFKGLNALKAQANKDKGDSKTIKKVAAQFESLFVGMMLKSMRQAHLAKGIFDNNQSNMYRDMSDQQLASDLTSKGGLGLQNMIIKQLGGHVDKASQSADKPGQFYSIDTVKVRPAVAASRQIINTIDNLKQAPKSAVSQVTAGSMDTMTFDSPQSFVQKLWPYAEKAAKSLGVKPEVLLSQAALETGWGKHIVSDSAVNSHNLFNIKADSAWQGDEVIKKTREYYSGKAVTETAPFRAYDSYQKSFDDYVSFIKDNPRYSQALQKTGDSEGFVEALHKAGYATDPDYANKIKRIMNSKILVQASASSFDLASAGR